jgi:hypothetical protein
MAERNHRRKEYFRRIFYLKIMTSGRGASSQFDAGTFQENIRVVLDVHKKKFISSSPEYFPEIQGYEDGVSARILTNVPLFHTYYSHKGESAGEVKDGHHGCSSASEYKSYGSLPISCTAA